MVEVEEVVVVFNRKIRRGKGGSRRVGGSEEDQGEEAEADEGVLRGGSEWA